MSSPPDPVVVILDEDDDPLAEPLLPPNPSGMTTAGQEEPQPKSEDNEQTVSIDEDIDEAVQPPTSFFRRTIVRSEENRGQPSSPSGICRDAFFAGLFVAQFGAVMGLAIAWGVPVVRQSLRDLHHSIEFNDDLFTPSRTTSTATVYLPGLLILMGAAGLGSFFISAVTLACMTRFAKFLVQLSVLGSLLGSLIVMIMCLVEDYDAGAIIAFSFFFIGCIYAFSVWHRIPFAASNLVTALTAIKTNAGVFVVPYAMVIIMCGYTILWILAVWGVAANRMLKCETQEVYLDEPVVECRYDIQAWVIALFLLAFLWTQAVLKDVIHVTVAGVVGTFWFDPPDANSCCSPSIGDSVCRSITTSFGSLCLGSLVRVVLVQALRGLADEARRRNRSSQSVLNCLADCLSNLLDAFNRYAFVYVGLHGYPYITAGRKVAALFHRRGWSTIITDQLVSRVLTWASLVIGGVTGLIGAIVLEAFDPTLLSFDDGTDDVDKDQNPQIVIAFLCSFALGTLVATILMSVVGSAVDTVVVCFAEAPSELRTHHPELSQAMEEAWYQTFPIQYHYVPEQAFV